MGITEEETSAVQEETAEDQEARPGSKIDPHEAEEKKLSSDKKDQEPQSKRA